MKNCFLIFTFLLPLAGFTQVYPAGIFTDHMVLQREQPLVVFGKAVPGAMVNVGFAGLQRTTTVRQDSSWEISLPAQEKNNRPQQLTISSGKETIILNDILIGDIWICIGQSNMEWPMVKEKHYSGETRSAAQPLLRFFNPVYAGKNIFGTEFTDSVIRKLNPGHFYEGRWEQSDSNSFKTMSAVAWYFGKRIVTETEVPAGLINLSIGGAPLETFIDKSVLQNDTKFAAKVKGDWLINDALPVWVRERGRQNTGTANNVPFDENGKAHAFKPGFAYTAGIEPLLRMPVKGILCYQGESNAQEAERVDEYAALSKLMIDDYRKKWKAPQLPFYFVQLSSIDTLKYKGHLWPQFRNVQREMLDMIPNSGMAVCSDIGARDDVHPANKMDVGERLARWALYKTDHRNIVPSGPLPVRARYKKGKVVILFAYTAKRLETADNRPLRGISIDGINGSRAVIRKKRVIVYTNSRPLFVYYGWKPYSDGNLVNSEQLPASTFKLAIK